MDTLENPITGEKIKIAKNDFPERMTWIQAKLACKDLGEGWRLPTKVELNEMYINRDEIGGFRTDTSVTSWYWTSTEYDKIEAWRQDFNGGHQQEHEKINPYYVRAVRAL